VSAGTSNAADANCGIDYGDYGALDFAAGTMWPAWADNSNLTGDDPDGACSHFDQYAAPITVRGYAPIVTQPISTPPPVKKHQVLVDSLV
jgi:hypothetical protein